MIRFDCPACRSVLTVPADRAGQLVQCPACRNQTIVPTATPPEAAGGLARAGCPNCGKTVGIRPDQFGKRLRCPACRRAFSIDQSARPGGPTVVTFEGDDPAPPADDANELARAPLPHPPRQSPTAKLTARFDRVPEVVYQAAVQAVRECRGTIVHLDQTNRHVRFAIPLTTGEMAEHDLFVIGMVAPCEVDITSRDPNDGDRFDPLYRALVREMGKYLLFAVEPPSLPPPPPPPALPSWDRISEPSPVVRRRRRRDGGTNGVAIAGFVCGLVGVVVFCIPLLAGTLGTLGIIFGSAGLVNSRRGENGFAVAGLALGIIACVLAFIMFVLAVDLITRRGY